VRVSSISPEWLYDEIALTMQAGIAHPMVLNDDVWIPNLVREGYDYEDACYYYNMGCVEILLQGRIVGWRGAGGGYDFPGIFEMLFRPDATNRAGRQGVPVDLSKLQTFDDFLNAYLAELTHLIDTKLPPSVARGEAEDARRYDAFASAFTLDCLDRGRDMHHGGARYPAIRNAGGFGLGTAVDSLAAIKRHVYEEGDVSLEELRDAVLANFEGNEVLRRRLAGAPAFGTDDAQVDAIAQRVFDHFCDTVHSYNEKLDVAGRCATVFFSYNRHVDMGEIIIATPNGRRSGEPMSDAIGPTQGRDVQGPTALMRSVLKLDPAKVTGAFALNIKLSTKSVEGAVGLAALKGLVKTYVAQKGVQMQVNVVDAEELRAAQQDPEAHRGLIVRVAGYSEFFCNLDKGLQDEIIARTAHEAV
jgi:formate C-acetyltransferase